MPFLKIATMSVALLSFSGAAFAFCPMSSGHSGFYGPNGCWAQEARRGRPYRPSRNASPFFNPFNWDLAPEMQAPSQGQSALSR